jgi:RNA recognition motif-containing protein
MERALTELNGVSVLGRMLRVSRAIRKAERQTPVGPLHSVFVGNLSWDVTREIIEDMLSDILGAGACLNIRLAFDQATGRARGFGHLDFADLDTAERAVRELNNMELMGRQLRVDLANGARRPMSSNGARPSQSRDRMPRGAPGSGSRRMDGDRERVRMEEEFVTQRSTNDDNN